MALTAAENSCAACLSVSVAACHDSLQSNMSHVTTTLLKALRLMLIATLVHLASEGVKHGNTKAQLQSEPRAKFTVVLGSATGLQMLGSEAWLSAPSSSCAL